jgi:hypothetical protein
MEQAEKQKHTILKIWIGDLFMQSPTACRSCSKSIPVDGSLFVLNAFETQGICAACAGFAVEPETPTSSPITASESASPDVW